MLNIATGTPSTSDVDLDDFPRPAIDEYGRFLHRGKELYAHLACTLRKLGTWDDFGVRVLPNEEEGYASIHFRIPAALPAASQSQLAEFAAQRIPYTERDRDWDARLGGPTSDRRFQSAFVDSVIAAVDFASAALESAVWAHARGREWTWPHSAPGRDESKYDDWGTDHPSHCFGGDVPTAIPAKTESLPGIC
ncbi:hypothetical protein QNO21_13975 [Microbacterium sp. zg-Y818]|uniref:hypothetical protein n=1 Tax=unclassified Microbacterium TaxID=2609290 RepID=UPI00214BD773|nr:MULTISPECIES: hypothetical protein [unclassified Microbacterium]MCR2800234.1 hypothetical protein [Microbacterium sp. zg.Y818]WIM22200.1 hypothetical protein QNO21_13975 [Microbacterium sp. zg-Y818]